MSMDFLGFKKVFLACVVLLFVAALPLCAFAQDAPYDAEEFQAVLDASKLQYPDSEGTEIEAGEFEGESRDYFYLTYDTYMNFVMSSDDGNRLELRQEEEWYTSTSNQRAVNARVTIFTDDVGTLNEFTFLQIHDYVADEAVGPNKPLIRLHWNAEQEDSEGQSWSDYIFLTIRNADSEEDAEDADNHTFWKQALVPRPDGFFEASIAVLDNTMTVTIDGTALNVTDVSYWQNLPSYFKAGSYLQGTEDGLSGTGHVQFDELTYVGP